MLDSCLSGQVYSLGRAEYGRLGLGEGAEEKSEPTPVMGIELAKGVSCGASVSYAVTREGENQGNRDGKSKTTESVCSLFLLLLFSSEALKCNETLYFALNRSSFKFILQTHDPSFPVCLDIAAGDGEIAASLIQL